MVYSQRGFEAGQEYEMMVRISLIKIKSEKRKKVKSNVSPIERKKRKSFLYYRYEQPIVANLNVVTKPEFPSK